MLVPVHHFLHMEIHGSALHGRHGSSVDGNRVTKAGFGSLHLTAYAKNPDATLEQLQVNYDIRTIQALLGHSDVRTTMIYTHCVPSKTAKERKSPLDL
jgi:integrase